MNIIEETKNIDNCVIWRKEFDEVVIESMEESKQCRFQIQWAQTQPRGKRNACGETAFNGG